MKKNYIKAISLITVFIITFLCCKAQKSDDSGIVFKATDYQLGVIQEGASTACVFSFVNKGDTPVAITNVKIFCGCIELDWTKEPVKPGGSGKIKVKFYASTVGTFSKTIKVFTNRSEQPIDLKIKGSVSVKSNNR